MRVAPESDRLRWIRLILNACALCETMNMEFDVIVVGGGMVGASLARALSGCGLRIAVVESWTLNSARQPSYDDRAIALAYGTRLILEGMGLWRDLSSDVEPILHVHVSDRGHFGFTRLHHESLNVEALGYVATGHDLGNILFRGIGDLPHVELFCPASLVDFDVSENGVHVTVSRNDEELNLNGRLLVAADGSRSMVRERLSINVREWQYGQSAVISNLTPGVPPNGTAFERFTESGPMAMLPLNKGRYGLIWTVDDSRLHEVMSWDDSEFLTQVQQCFGHRLGRFERAGRRASYPLSLVRAEEHIRPRVVLIGNAAHALHPITGQGFNLGIRDVAALADVLVEADQNGRDPGALETLSLYAEWRRHDQQAVALMTDSLVRLFANPLLPIRIARDIGMLALDLASPAKHFLTRQFMGINGRLPRLARGLGLEC